MGGMGGGKISLTLGILRPLYGNINVIFLLMVPLITMRLFAEEKKQHTLELLLTAPISLGEIVIGKFLSAFMLISVMLGLTLLYPIVLFMTGNPDLGPVVGCYLGSLLLTSCYLAIGILFSSVTENQIVAGALSFAAGLFFWLIEYAKEFTSGLTSEFFAYLSLNQHYENFSQGIINTSDVLFYLSFIGLGLFLTHRVLDSNRWND